VRVGPYRKRSQVLVLTHPEACAGYAAYLTSLGTVLNRVRAEKADVVAVVGPDPSSGAPSPPFPLLVDEDVVGPALAPDRTPVVVVADRYGQIFTRFDAAADHAFPDTAGSWPACWTSPSAARSAGSRTCRP
jgi:hypothetical protein